MRGVILQTMPRIPSGPLPRTGGKKAGHRSKTGIRGIAFYDDGRVKPYQVWLKGTYCGTFATLEEAKAALDRKTATV